MLDPSLVELGVFALTRAVKHYRDCRTQPTVEQLIAAILEEVEPVIRCDERRRLGYA